MAGCIREKDGTALADIKVLPGASKSRLSGEKEGRLWLRIAAPPLEGRANAELVSFFAKLLGCPKRDVHLMSGEKSRLKTLAFPQKYREKLAALIKDLEET